ncbi:hypothetical protein NMG29_22415 [Streptomyces cocklensis]|uniref:Uncharacterized protein n=1 Tax=Actinacidiphila cocklensis TaxID=887465 RepID=A0A9W4DJY4_9ACTN|nr:hypothetical protein [Actinacidiphila cocklensis]MDD1060936.1 hypothetical protein [Actinacidiphila cocklensis]WSX77263.1 hypothetical protein OH826_27525 [Streptomyces sp. NBC_00899]CAG6391569.1 conserved hypothetical protein [Actinacidiphila cocklensis]
MRRHRFEPAALVMGLVLITLTVFFLLDAGGVWDLHPWTAGALAFGGLVLAAAAGIVTQAARTVRARRERRRP